MAKNEELKEYRMIGAHPYEVHVGDKVIMCAPGEFVELSEDDIKQEDNKNLKDLGILIDTEKTATPRARDHSTEPEEK